LVTYLNPEAERLTGWSRSAAYARSVQLIFSLCQGGGVPPLAHPLLWADAPQSKTGHALPEDCVLTSRQGSEVFIEGSTAPLIEENGTLAGAVVIFRDVTTARAHSQELRHRSQHDPLTHLPNRHLLAARVAAAKELASGRRSGFGMIYLDLDGLKELNDTGGHALGDHVLQQVAARLLRCVRSDDTVSRIGGDEFVLMVNDIDSAQGMAHFAQRIMEALAEPLQLDEEVITISASFGIALYPQDGVDLESLLKSADAALYCAKNAGRCNYRFYGPAIAAALSTEPAGFSRRLSRRARTEHPES
jgi:diguanylate cyclase (GGDEF)-like protein